MNNIIKIIIELIGKVFAAQSKPAKEEETFPEFEIIDSTQTLPWHKTRTWSKRALKSIDKIIVHQELANGTIESVNNYHITPGPKNSLSPKGAPHFAYHYGIDLDGSVHKANPHSATAWHCRGQNSKSVGIMVAGDFSGEGHEGSAEPTALQLRNLNLLLDKLLGELNLSNDNIYGHEAFGKPACPGYIVMEEINKRRSQHE